MIHLDITLANIQSFNRYTYGNNNPYRYTDPDGRSSCDGSSASKCIQADTFDAALSSGKNVQASDSVANAMVAGKGVVAVTSGTKEKIGFVVPTSDGAHQVVAAEGATTASTGREDSASASRPANAAAVIHGHIDGVTNGVVSPRDARPLQSGLPNGVVSEGRVGVTELVNGRLQFRMLQGKMGPREVRELQKSLDNQQEQFMTPAGGQ